MSQNPVPAPGLPVKDDSAREPCAAQNSRCLYKIALMTVIVHRLDDCRIDLTIFAAEGLGSIGPVISLLQYL